MSVRVYEVNQHDVNELDWMDVLLYEGSVGVGVVVVVVVVLLSSPESNIIEHHTTLIIRHHCIFHHWILRSPTLPIFIITSNFFFSLWCGIIGSWDGFWLLSDAAGQVHCHHCC